jgi:hypothetical protein
VRNERMFIGGTRVFFRASGRPLHHASHGPPPPYASLRERSAD